MSCWSIMRWCCGGSARAQRIDEDLEAMIPARNAQAEESDEEQPISLRTKAEPSGADFDVADAMKTALQRIPTGNVSKFTGTETAAAGEALVSAFSSLLHEDLRIAVVTEIFNWGRTARQLKRKELAALFHMCVSRHLQAKEVQELRDILANMPPAVLGDKSGTVAFLV